MASSNPLRWVFYGRSYANRVRNSTLPSWICFAPKETVKLCVLNKRYELTCPAHPGDCFFCRWAQPVNSRLSQDFQVSLPRSFGWRIQGCQQSIHCSFVPYRHDSISLFMSRFVPRHSTWVIKKVVNENEETPLALFAQFISYLIMLIDGTFTGVHESFCPSFGISANETRALVTRNTFTIAI